MEKFKALGYYIILKRVEPKIKKSKIGLEYSDDHRQDIRYIKGEVISAGPLAEGINVGSLVLYDKIAGNSLEAEDELLKCVSVKDIIIVYDGKE